MEDEFKKQVWFSKEAREAHDEKIRKAKEEHFKKLKEQQKKRDARNI